MSEERILAFDSIQIEKRIIAEDDKVLTMPAVIASEIVHRYNDGMAYKSAKSLKKSFDTVSRVGVLPLTVLRHPDVGLITLNSEVHGKVDNFEFVNNLIDPKTQRPNRKGIRANLTWFKDLVAPNIIESIKKGDLVDNSIGFTFKKIAKPGEWNGDKYDYEQDDIFLNHVAAPVPKGRCPYPLCGINVDCDSLTFEIAGDPWEETDKYIRSGHGQIKEGMVCRTSDYNGKLPDGILAVSCHMPDSEDWWEQSFLFPKAKGWDLAKAKAWFTQHRKDSISEGVLAAVSKDAMTPEQIQAKIEGLYTKRDDLQAQSNETMKPIKVMPETQKLWRQIEDLDLEIRAYKELKVQMIAKQGAADGAGSAECPLCEDIKKLGLKRTTAMLVRDLGLDNVMLMFEKEKLIGRDTEADKTAQIARAKRTGIAIKEGGNVTKPSKYADVPDGEFADETNFGYPISEKYVEAAWKYWGMPDNRAVYSSEEQAIITKRIEAAMKKYGHETNTAAGKKDEAPAVEISTDALLAKVEAQRKLQEKLVKVPL